MGLPRHFLSCQIAIQSFVEKKDGREREARRILRIRGGRCSGILGGLVGELLSKKAENELGFNTLPKMKENELEMNIDERLARNSGIHGWRWMEQWLDIRMIARLADTWMQGRMDE